MVVFFFFCNELVSVVSCERPRSPTAASLLGRLYNCVVRGEPRHSRDRQTSLMGYMTRGYYCYRYHRSSTHPTTTRPCRPTLNRTYRAGQGGPCRRAALTTNLPTHRISHRCCRSKNRPEAEPGVEKHRSATVPPPPTCSRPNGVAAAYYPWWARCASSVSASAHACSLLRAHAPGASPPRAGGASAHASPPVRSSCRPSPPRRARTPHVRWPGDAPRALRRRHVPLDPIQHLAGWTSNTSTSRGAAHGMGGPHAVPCVTRRALLLLLRGVR